MFDYQKEYNAYWSRPDRWGSHSFAEPQSLVDQVLRTCGTGSLLDVGCGMGLLVRTFLASGVDAHGLDVAAAPVVQALQFAPGRFHLGSILNLPFPAESFTTVISTDCLEHLGEADVPQALAELNRVTKRYCYVRLATSADRDKRWHLTIHNRAWWETRFFEAGFRKHPLWMAAVGFESLENEVGQITLLFEKIPSSAFQKYPLTARQTGSDLYDDRLRETGRRSDTGIAAYNLALDYIRPNDTVLDLACGSGYGAAILWDGSEAATVVGSDANASAIDYAQANYSPQRAALVFRHGEAGNLSTFTDTSIDVVVGFEIMEHLDAPQNILNEVRRVLKPGGRFICSLPNTRVDKEAQGSSPRPEASPIAKIKAFLSKHLLIEQVFMQGAGHPTESTHRPRCLVEIPAGAQSTDQEAEWWLLVGMKDPVGATKKNYVETIFPTGLKEEPNITAFARDYHNPWLVRSMVTLGQRCRSATLLRDLALRVLESAPPGSADAGAALCVSGYLQLESKEPSPTDRKHLIGKMRRYIASAENTPHAARWRISNQYVLAKLLLSAGETKSAREEFWKCAQMDCLVFSPLLATKTVDAAFWTGWLAAANEDWKEARAAWKHGIEEARRVLSGSWSEVEGNPDSPVLFGLREATVVLDAATRCSNGLYTLEQLPRRPGFSITQILYSLSRELKRQEAVIAAERHWATSLHEGKAWLERQNAELKSWIQELDRARAWLEEQRSVWQHTAQEREKLTQEQRDWSRTLEEAKNWLDQQLVSWREVVKDRDQIIAEQRAWMSSLEHGKSWLETERNRWQQLANERWHLLQANRQELDSLKRDFDQGERQRAELLGKIERQDAHIRDVEKRFLYRALARLKLLPLPVAGGEKPK